MSSLFRVWRAAAKITRAVCSLIFSPVFASTSSSSFSSHLLLLLLPEIIQDEDIARSDSYQQWDRHVQKREKVQTHASFVDEERDVDRHAHFQQSAKRQQRDIA